MILVLAVGFVSNLNAQNTDGFFKSSYEEYQERNEVPWGGATLPSLPGFHGYDYDHSCEPDQSAPVGSGLLLLAGMGAAYALRRKRK